MSVLARARVNPHTYVASGDGTTTITGSHHYSAGREWSPQRTTRQLVSIQLGVAERRDERAQALVGHCTGDRTGWGEPPVEYSRSQVSSVFIVLATALMRFGRNL